MKRFLEFIRAHAREAAAGGIVLVGTGLAALLMNGIYPIVVVNGTMISAARFRMNYRSAYFYAENLRKAYAAAGGARSTISEGDLERQVLEALIEAALVGDGVRREVGRDLGYLVLKKLENYEAEADDLGKATEMLYGLRYDEFQKEVLVPQAKEDILAGRLFLRNERIDDWLREAKQGARVTIFSDKFSWDGVSVRAAGK